jgi:hypothetical protein
MEVLYPRCAGLDVHKDSVFARVRCVSEPRHDEVRNFGTTTTALFELNEWLSTHGVLIAKPLNYLAADLMKSTVLGFEAPRAKLSWCVNL